MNREKFDFLIKNLVELKDHEIISDEQFDKSKDYFQSLKKDQNNVETILTAIGIFLLALSIVTIFAFNWDNLSSNIKLIVSFLPLVITCGMIGLTLKKDMQKLRIYTSIFAPISIFASNLLISQTLHINNDIKDLVFLSIIMFLPIAAIFKNIISIVFYGIGVMIYASLSHNNLQETIKTILISLPLISYYIYGYIKNGVNVKNSVLWLVNVIIITILLVVNELLNIYSMVIYTYMTYLTTRQLLGEKNFLTKISEYYILIVLLLLSTSHYLLGFASNIEFDVNIIVFSVLSLALLINLKMYKKIKDIIILFSIIILQYIGLEEEILMILINLTLAVLGIYYIIFGEKAKSYNSSIGGVLIILFIITIRLFNSDFDLIEKGIAFLASGVIFLIVARVLKNRMVGSKYEK